MGRLKGMLAAQVLCTVITFFYVEQIVSNTDWKSLSGRSQCQSYKWNFWSCQWTTGWANNGKIRKDNSERTVFLRKFRKAWDLSLVGIILMWGSFVESWLILENSLSPFARYLANAPEQALWQTWASFFWFFSPSLVIFIAEFRQVSYFHFYHTALETWE